MSHNCIKKAHEDIKAIQRQLKINADIKVEAGQVWKDATGGWSAKILNIGTIKFGSGIQLAAACVVTTSQSTFNQTMLVSTILRNCELVHG